VRSRLSDKFVILVAVFGLVLAQAPKLFGSTTSARALALLPFLCAIAFTSAEVTRPRYHPPRWMLGALWLYLAVLSVMIMRAVGVDSSIATTRSAALVCLQFVILAWFAYRLIAAARNETERWKRLVAIALAPAVYVAFNLLIMKVKLPLITVPPQATGPANGTPATYLGALGVHATRSNLPLASGVNGSGAISAAGFAAAALLALRARRPRKRLTVSAALLCAYATLMSDSHAALIIAVGIVGLFAVLPRARRFSGVALIAVLSPAIVVLSVGLISALGVGFLGRGGGEGVSTVNDRVRIWKAAWTAVDDADAYHLLVGYGAYGQVTSGASRGYAGLFEGVTPEPLHNTVHDLTLQTLLDGGVIAVIALLLLGIAVFTSLGRATARGPSPPIQALLAILVVLLLNGATEALPSYQFAESLNQVLLVAGAAIALAPIAVQEPRRRRASSSHVESQATGRLVSVRQTNPDRPVAMG